MPNVNRAQDEKLLAERLRREALDERPKFSESLHDRICRAVHECSASHAPTLRHLTHTRATLRWAVAGAAICVLAALVVLWRANVRNRQSDLAATGGQLAGLPTSDSQSVPEGPEFTADLSPVSRLTDRVASRIPALVDSTLTIDGWAYLDHDARLSAELLAQRLPLDVGSLLAEGSRE